MVIYHGNQFSVYIKYGEYVDQLCHYQLHEVPLLYSINFLDYFLNENTGFSFLNIYIFSVTWNCVSDHSVKKMLMTSKNEKFDGSLYSFQT
jgi:hypothetical protein